MAEYDGMSREEIEQALVEAQQEHEEAVQASKAKIRDLAGALNMKLAVEEAERMTAGLTSEQRDRLAQLIRSDGIASGEEVGTPGNE